ncbi:thiolase-like protein [Mycena floridula]|nr:thiolase-like protein [Mycena floridula]
MSLLGRRLLHRFSQPAFRRSASTLPQGYASVVRKDPNDVVFTFAKRTALGQFQNGQLSDVSVEELLHALFKATLSHTKLNPSKIEDICVGMCSAESPVYSARSAALAAGLPRSTTISIVNRLGSSGLESIRHIANAIRAGEISIGAAVGVEILSQRSRPRALLDARTAQAAAMPERQHEYDLTSQRRVEESFVRGFFEDEIIPIEIAGKVIDTDDTIRPPATDIDDMDPELVLSDGGALVILTTRERALQEGLEVLGKYVGATTRGYESKVTCTGGIQTIQKMLGQVGLSTKDVDVYEACAILRNIHEIFSSQMGYLIEKLQVPIAKVNPNGGSFALSDATGLSGMRQVVAGLAELTRLHRSILCTSICSGAGMGASGLFVNESSIGVGDSG